MERQELRDARLSLSEHVVMRRFPEETIVLNLESGQYHGLNPTAALMVETVAAGQTPVQAAAILAERFGQPTERVEEDLLVLLESLVERGLVDAVGPV